MIVKTDYETDGSFYITNIECCGCSFISSVKLQKMDKVELAGSLVAKCWSTFVDESEKIVKMVKENADFLASTTLDMLTNLFTEKRNNRKFYHEEHGRICLELQRLQDSVARLRGDYERCVDNYTSCKAKYDEQKGKGSKRIEEFKDRYLKVIIMIELSDSE